MYCRGMDTDTAPRTMQVRIRDRASESPWGVGPVNPCVRTVTISDRCPVCSGERGAPSNLNQCDDGAYYSVDVWRNPCGHVDLYENVARESAVLARDSS